MTEDILPATVRFIAHRAPPFRKPRSHEASGTEVVNGRDKQNT